MKLALVCPTEWTSHFTSEGQSGCDGIKKQARSDDRLFAEQNPMISMANAVVKEELSNAAFQLWNGEERSRTSLHSSQDTHRSERGRIVMVSLPNQKSLE